MSAIGTKDRRYDFQLLVLIEGAFCANGSSPCEAAPSDDLIDVDAFLRGRTNNLLGPLGIGIGACGSSGGRKSSPPKIHVEERIQLRECPFC
jgi:hypothetical protein